MSRTRRVKKVSARRRKIDRENALKGTRKWAKTPTGARRAERVRSAHDWGFEGQSPQTRKRVYKRKRD